MNFELNLEMTIALTAVFFSLTGMLSALFSYRQYRNCRGLLEFTGQQMSELEHSALTLQEVIEGQKKKASDQSRRIAWLESRVRQPKLMKEDVVDDKTPAKPVQWNMTERRHRVLTLASRGLALEKIAATLGMMPGEVELIINLSQASYAASA